MTSTVATPNTPWAEGSGFCQWLLRERHRVPLHGSRGSKVAPAEGQPARLQIVEMHADHDIPHGGRDVPFHGDPRGVGRGGVLCGSRRRRGALAVSDRVRFDPRESRVPDHAAKRIGSPREPRLLGNALHLVAEEHEVNGLSTQRVARARRGNHRNLGTHDGQDLLERVRVRTGWAEDFAGLDDADVRDAALLQRFEGETRVALLDLRNVGTTGPGRHDRRQQ